MVGSKVSGQWTSPTNRPSENIRNETDLSLNATWLGRRLWPASRYSPVYPALTGSTLPSSWRR